MKWLIYIRFLLLLRSVGYFCLVMNVMLPIKLNIFRNKEFIGNKTIKRKLVGNI